MDVRFIVLLVWYLISNRLGVVNYSAIDLQLIIIKCQILFKVRLVTLSKKQNLKKGANKTC